MVSRLEKKRESSFQLREGGIYIYNWVVEDERVCLLSRLLQSKRCISSNVLPRTGECVSLASRLALEGITTLLLQSKRLHLFECLASSGESV